MKHLLLLSLLLPMATLGSNECDLVGEKQVYPLRDANGENAGRLELIVDAFSGQVRFDSFAENGYKMYDQHIFFDDIATGDPLPNDPEDFFMSAEYAGTTRWVGYWVINPFYCGPQDMRLSFHSTMKKNDGNAVDVYAYDSSSTGVAASFPNEVSFQLRCISCDDWTEPDHDEWLANLNPFGPGIGNENNGSGSTPSSTSSSSPDVSDERIPSSYDPWTTRSAEKLHLNCPRTSNEASCQDLVTKEGRIVGHTCVSVNPVSNQLQITNSALEPRSLIRTQLWTSTDGIGRLPMNEDGGLNTKAFLHYQCDYEGRKFMRYELSFADECGSAGEDLLEVTVVVHALVHGEGGDNEDAFPKERVVESSHWFGYMSVPLHCGCDEGEGEDESVRRLRRRQF